MLLWQLPIAIAVLLALATAIFIATRPSKKEFTESLAINSSTIAPLFEIVTDLRRWNPWAEWDSGAKTSFMGPSYGLGAVLEWQSAGNAGSGSLTITQLTGQSAVSYLFEETAPETSLQVTHLAFEVKDSVTTATWRFTRRLGFMGKAAAFFGISDGVRVKLKRGLAALNTRFEAEARGERPARLMHCSFCGKSQREVKKLISGPNVCICDECLSLSFDIIAEEIERDDPGPALVELGEPELLRSLGLPALRWGMTRDEVRGVVPAVDEDRSNLVGSLEEGVVLRCSFTEDRLDGITLSGKIFAPAITEKLGEPSRRQSGLLRWLITTADVIEGPETTTVFARAVGLPATAEGAEKLKTLEGIVATSIASLVVDATRDDVRVPERFKSQAKLLLNVSHRYTSALHMDEGGVVQVLQFAKEEFRVVLPWAAIEHIGAAR